MTFVTAPRTHPASKQLWITLAVLLGVGVLYLAFAPSTADKEDTSDYDELEACAFLTSIDSRKSLYLSRSHMARLSLNGGAGTQWETGSWRLVDEEKRLFEVSLGDAKTIYTLVSAPEGEGCMLVPGDTSKADLGKSWFSTLQDPK